MSPHALFLYLSLASAILATIGIPSNVPWLPLWAVFFTCAAIW